MPKDSHAFLGQTNRQFPKSLFLSKKRNYKLFNGRMKRKLEIFEYGSNLTPIDENSYSSSHFLQISISGSGSELSSVSSTHPSPKNSMDSVSNGESLASLHSTIVNKIEMLFKDRGIGVPDGWSTYEILEQLVVNDDNLFQNPSFLYDMIFDLSVSKNPCWFEAAVDSILLILC